ncbi:hypothetical protein FKG94_18600 [Exilibacterium tricleocarpae]|uniref:Uncharacterized protein n=1 Tax=Exilibacterium tricleocarpae TaxID=2591008 RepID=A0A545T648_9GAMM|nr:hypothetical protein [Exilibacterium tricleocarpae]TQV72699.1 hypothetical protein FKG94_18600 [Exilibacterium tricleocarpae]
MKSIRLFGLAAAIAAAIATGPAQAALCGDDRADPALHLGYGIYQTAAVERGGVEREDSLFTDIDLATGRWGFAHRYRAYEFEETQAPGSGADQLQTNGDVHQLSVRRQWRQERGDAGWLAGVAPLLSVSSNLLKNPDAIGSDAWQVHGYAEYRRRLDRNWQWLLGACADDRFDHYRIYPLAGLIWQPNADWELRLAFPDSRIQFTPAPRWQLYLSAAPNGAAWQVYNEELDQLSRLRYRSWRLRFGALWQVGRQWQVGAEWGADTERKFDFRRTAGDRQSTAADTARYGALRVTWRW